MSDVFLRMATFHATCLAEYADGDGECTSEACRRCLQPCYRAEFSLEQCMRGCSQLQVVLRRFVWG